MSLDESVIGRKNSSNLDESAPHRLREKPTWEGVWTTWIQCVVYLKDPIVALDKALKYVENSCWRVCWPENIAEEAFPNGRCWLLPKFVGEADLGGRLALLGPPWVVCVYAQHPWSGMCQGAMDRMASSFSS